MANRLRHKLYQLECADEGCVILPFGFTINGTSDPDGLTGVITAVTRSEAGEFLCTLYGEPVSVYCGYAEISSTADDVDIYGKVDWSTVATNGQFTVRCMTGATQTDPTDNLLVGGFLLVKKTNRARR